MAAMLEDGHRKVVLVGDDACDKESLCRVVLSDCTPSFRPMVTDITVNNTMVKLQLHPLPSEPEECIKLRMLAYPGTDVIITCFSIANRDSLVHIKTKWYPEIQQHCHGLPIILVGTQKDTRACNLDNDPTRIVQFKEGQKLAKTLRAAAYVECSTKTHEGVEKVFEEVAKAIFKDKGNNPKCLLI